MFCSGYGAIYCMYTINNRGIDQGKKIEKFLAYKYVIDTSIKLSIWFMQENEKFIYKAITVLNSLSKYNYSFFTYNYRIKIH